MLDNRYFTFGIELVFNSSFSYGYVYMSFTFIVKLFNLLKKNNIYV